MKIVIKTDKTNFSMPVPLKMASFAIKNIPDSVLERFREKLPPEYAKAICKENLAFIFEECRPELEKFKGLEVINAKKQDGSFISVVLQKEVTTTMGFIKMKKAIAACFIVVLSLTFTACSGSEQSGASLPAEGEMAAHFIDVGQADCTLIVSEGEAMLIDAGNQPDDELIISYLDDMGIDKLKFIVFTHPHEDHIGSGESIINAFDVDKIFMLDEYDDGIEGYLKEEIEYLGIGTEAPYPGDTAQLGECKIEFLGPIYDYDDTNDDSICLKITHGENSMLFTGDAGNGPERDMIEEGIDLETDLFHAGHHGSSKSNSYYFLRESNPRYVVISCEKDNMYGHPHEEALSRFNDLGAEIFRTDDQGTVIAVSDGKTLTFNVEGKKSDRPYTEDHEDAKYIGNVNSKKYHVPSCSGLPQEDNRSYFMTREAAEKAGYDPCGNCRP